ncbi:MAG: FKBP-type peptidyl-prolyl cis-trans isomerase [Phycisphaerae bacterium]
MTKAFLVFIPLLAGLSGCIELQRSMNPKGAVAVEGPAFGPVVTDEDLEGARADEDVDQDAAADAGTDGDAAPDQTDQGGPPELADGLAEVTTDSGLTLIEIEEGTGGIAANGDVVEAHYDGWLESDGTKFDSSIDRGTPFTFTLGTGQVIDGWDEGFLDMKVGGRRRLIIPPTLAYGDQGQPAGGIPPGATLIFDVELLSLNP